MLDSLLTDYKRPYEWKDSVQPQALIGMTLNQLLSD